MLRGTVRSFSLEQAGGEVVLEDGRVFRFVYDVVRPSVFPSPGAEAIVKIGPRRFVGEGVVSIEVLSRTRETFEPAVFLDAIGTRSLVWREASATFTEVEGHAAFAPGQPVMLRLEEELAYRTYGSSAPQPRGLLPASGALPAPLLRRFRTMFAKAARAYGKERWNDEDRTWQLRGLGRVLATAGDTPPRSSVFRRLLRPLDGTMSAQLGLPLGPCAQALFAAAARARPTAPADAFRGLGLQLPVLGEVVADDVRGAGPVPCVPFATNGGEATYGAIDTGDGRPLDDSPILMWEADHTEVVANDLPSFLARVASGAWAYEGVAVDELAAPLRALASPAWTKPHRGALARARVALRVSTLLVL